MDKFLVTYIVNGTERSAVIFAVDACEASFKIGTQILPSASAEFRDVQIIDN